MKLIISTPQRKPQVAPDMVTVNVQKIIAKSGFTKAELKSELVETIVNTKIVRSIERCVERGKSLLFVHEAPTEEIIENLMDLLYILKNEDIELILMF